MATATFSRSDSSQRNDTRVLVAVRLARHTDELVTKLRNAGCEVLQAESIEELFDMAVRCQPNVIVLDSDGSYNVIRVVAQVADLAPEAALMVLFEQPDETELLAVIHAGALGYLNVTIPERRLSAAIDAIMGGQPALPRSMTAILVRQLRSPGCITIRTRENRVIELSAREWDVLCRLQQGYSTNEIAERLFVCSATVRSHVAAIIRKLDVPDRDAALASVFAR